MNVFTRNIKAKLIALAVGLVVFVGLQVFSMTVMKDVYVFEWLGREKYGYVWVTALLLIIFDRTLVSYFVTLGAPLGAVIGQFLGDYLEEKSLAKITPDMDDDIRHNLLEHSHHGVFTFYATVLICLVIGTALSMILRKRRDRRQENT